MGQLSLASFRGQTSRNTLLKVDDIPVQTVEGSTNLSPFLGGATSLKKIIPGSQGVRYGNGATGGVILMETPFLDDHQTLTSEVGSFDSVYLHASSGMSHSSQEGVVHGESSYTSGLPQYGPRRQLGEKGRVGTMHVATALKRPLTSTTSFKITARYSEGNSKYDAFHAATSKPQSTEQRGLTLLGASLKNTSLHTTHHIQTFLSLNKIKESSPSLSEALLSGIDYTGEATWSPRSSSLLLAGVQDARFKSVAAEKTRASSYVGLIQQGKLSSRFSLEGGGRIDYHQCFGFHTTYTGTAAYALSEDMTLKSNARTGFLTPSLYSLYVTNAYVEGNPHLKSEKTQTIDLGVEGHGLNQRLSFQLLHFWTKIERMIYARQEGSRYQSLNLPGASHISGMESVVSYEVSPALTLEANYSYTNFDIKQANVNTEFPKHKVYLGGRIVGPHAIEISPDIQYISRRQSQGHDLKAYALFNVKIHHKMTPTISFYGRIDNLWDKRYVQTYDYQTPGRAFYVGAHLRF
jgi:vitamin B12 transporter